MTSNRIELFRLLSAVGGLSLVRSRDGSEKLIVNDPWRVANPALIWLSQVVLWVGVGLMLLGLFTSVLFLGVATNLLLLAMIIRLIAPLSSGLAVWNDFLVLGDPREFNANAAALSSEPMPLQHPLDNLEDELIPFGTKIGLAAAYALSVAGANTPDTLLKGITNYVDGLIMLTAGEGLWNMRTTAKGFFATCTGLGMFSIAMMIIIGGSAEFARWKLWVGPFVYLTGPTLYALHAPKWLRGRIMPYRGHFVMHQSPSLNAIMTIKIVLNFIASALCGVLIWVVVMFSKFVSDNLFGPKPHDAVVEHFYPTPTPLPGYTVVVLPFSLLSGLVILSHYGSSEPSYWPTVVTILIPGLLSFGGLFMGASSDVIRFLSTNFDEHVATELDDALDALFEVEVDQLAHRFGDSAQ
jgi:hypothetical protein